MLSSEKSSVRFEAISDDESSNHPLPSSRTISRAHLNIWKATTILFLCTTLLQIPFSNVFILSTYEHGFKTDFLSSEGADKVVERRFGYPIRSTPDGTLYIPQVNSSQDYPLPGQSGEAWQDDAARYVGEPSEERDQAWSDLTGPRYFALSGDERDWLHSDSSLNATTELPQLEGQKSAFAYGGLDVLHSLHCLDSLRKRIDRADFPDHGLSSGNIAIDESQGGVKADSVIADGFERMHVEHCLNQLRESIMCHSDTTPVTLKPVSVKTTVGSDVAVTVLLGETERMHSCRDFGRVRDWIKDMVEQRGSVV